MAPSLLSLIAASTAFVGMHFALSHPLRAPLVQLAGEKGFSALYSLVALSTFVWMVLAFRAVGPGGTPLWDAMGPVPWAVATVIMLVASVLLGGSFIRNPAFPAPGAAKLAAQEPHGVFRVTRHPMMWSFALWACAHILLRPTPRQIALAGAIAILALVGSHLQDRKKEAQMGDAWAGWEAKTSYWPRFGALAKAGTAEWIGGILGWLAVTWAHIHAAGVPAGIWRWIG